MSETTRDAIVNSWGAADRASALCASDRRAIDESETVRALIVDLTLGGVHDEALNACAVLGRLLAQHQVSPTLASLTVDHAAEALGSHGAAWIPAARAAVAEAFVAALLDAARGEAMQAWEFPRCIVPLRDGVIAIAAGHPTDDEELLAAWAARLAHGAALGGARQAIVAGPELARRAVIEALSVVGVRVGPPAA